MKETMLRLQENLVEIFPEISTIQVTTETILEEIPDWDSMAAINLQVFLNDYFGIDLEDDFLNDDTSFMEILELIEEPAT